MSSLSPCVLSTVVEIPPLRTDGHDGRPIHYQRATVFQLALLGVFVENLSFLLPKNLEQFPAKEESTYIYA
jgi:hypothetical protein